MHALARFLKVIVSLGVVFLYICCCF